IENAQAQGCAPPPQVAEPWAKTTLFAQGTLGRAGRPDPAFKLSDSRLQYALRLGDAIALGVVHPEAGQHLDNLRVLGELGNRLLTGEVPDLVDRAHHLAIDR